MKDMTHFQIILFIEWLKATYFVQDSEVIFFFSLHWGVNKTTTGGNTFSQRQKTEVIWTSWCDVTHQVENCPVI